MIFLRIQINIVLLFFAATHYCCAQTDIYPIQDVVGCYYYVLPSIQGNQLSGNETYFTGPSGTGASYSPGDTIFSTRILFAYDPGTGSPDEECFFIQIIHDIADLSLIRDDTACSFYVLPYFVQPGLSIYPGYYTGPIGTGVKYHQGDTIWHSISLFAFDGTVGCYAEKLIHITVDTMPVVDSIETQYGCHEYTLTLFPGTNIQDDLSYFSSGNQVYHAGDIIAASRNLFFHAINGKCHLQTEFEIQVLNELALYPIADTFICGNSLILPPISGDKTTSFARYYELFPGSDEAHKPGDHFNNPTSTTLYVYDSIPGTDCVDSTSWNINFTIHAQAFNNFTVKVCYGFTYDIRTLKLGNNIKNYSFLITPTTQNPVVLNGDQFNTSLYPPGNYEFFVIDTAEFPCIPDTAVMTVYSTTDCRNPDTTAIFCTYLNNPEQFDLAINMIENPGLCCGGIFTDLNGNPIINWDQTFELSRDAPDTFYFLYFLTNSLGQIDTAEVSIYVQDFINVDIEVSSPNALCKGDCATMKIHYLDDDQYFLLLNTKTSDQQSPDFNGSLFQEDFTLKDSICFCFLDRLSSAQDESQDTIFLPFGNRTYKTEIWELLKECQNLTNDEFQLQTLSDNTYKFEEAHCYGEHPILFGKEFSAEKPRDLILLNEPAVNGCDSFVLVDLTFYNPSTGYVHEKLCADDTAIINCIAYTRDFPRDTQFLPGAGLWGCDSTLIIDLEFGTLALFSLDTILCEGRVFHFAHLTFDSSGFYTGVIKGQNLCDSLYYSILISYTPMNPIPILVDQPLCDGSPGQISIPAEFTEIVWSTGETVSSISIVQPGEYSVTAFDSKGCTQTANISVPSEIMFSINGKSAYTTSAFEPIPFELTVIGNLESIIWHPETGLSCSTCLNPVANPLQSQTYNFEATSFEGCVDTGYVIVTINNETFFYIPNIISPKSDIRENRILSLWTKSTSVKYDLTIFDRWGGMMFRGNDLESNNLSQGWDGKSKGKFVSSGVYAFLINIKDIDYMVNGTVTVIY
jgi:hypothetical protein